MTAYVVSVDISHVRNPLPADYARGWAIFKATQGTNFVDPNLNINGSRAHDLYAAGKLGGAVAYHVLTNEPVGAQFDAIVRALGSTPPTWLAAVMQDVEAWPGTSYALHGDHSGAYNDLAGRIQEWLGSDNAAWGYANRYDDAALLAHRVTTPFIEAAYSSTLNYTSIRGAIGQQYSDGETKWAVPVIDGHSLPRSTPGLGFCDHNVFPGFADGHALRQFTRPVQEDDMTEAQFFAWMDAYFASCATNPHREALVHNAAFSDYNKAHRDGARHRAVDIAARTPGWVAFPAPAAKAEPVDAVHAGAASGELADQPSPTPEG